MGILSAHRAVELGEQVRPGQLAARRPAKCDGRCEAHARTVVREKGLQTRERRFGFTGRDEQAARGLDEMRTGPRGKCGASPEQRLQISSRRTRNRIEFEAVLEQPGEGFEKRRDIGLGRSRHGAGQCGNGDARPRLADQRDAGPAAARIGIQQLSTQQARRSALQKFEKAASGSSDCGRRALVWSNKVG